MPVKDAKHIVILLTILAVFSSLSVDLFAQFSGGKGSRFRPYHISTAEDLDLVRNYPSKHFRLINDIDLSDFEWQPIGDQTNPFTGSFDGRGFNITNLQVENKGSYTGLFGFVKGGRIKGVLLTDAYLTGSDNTGGLAGSVEKSRITNCGAEGKVFGTVNIGGLIGYSISSKVERCYASVDVYSNESNIGGLIGNCDIDNQIFNCYATGNVEGKVNVGGLAGYLGDKSSISNSYSIGKVNGSINVGGLVGRSAENNNYVTNSYWDTVTSYQTDSSAGEGLMTIDMVRDNSEYIDWSFNKVWAMVDYTTYPYLQWQDEPGVHNYPKHGYHKVYEGRTLYWESFPVLPDQRVDCVDVLYPLTDRARLDKIYAGNSRMMAWAGACWSSNMDFDKTKGYRLSFIDDEVSELIVPGVGVDYDNTSTVLYSSPSENWIGYWIPQPQHASDIFDDPEFDYIKEVRSEEWAISRFAPGGDWEAVPLRAYLTYGKMYEIVIFDYANKQFSWPLPKEPYYPPEPKALPTNFTFQSSANYEVFNIMSIENDEDVEEVGIFAGNTCVGASVFEGEYPLQILAYTNASLSGEIIKFVVHRGDQGEKSVIRKLEVMDFEMGKYYEEVLQPWFRRVATVRLGAGEEETEEKKSVEPQFALSQNYPNPLVLDQTSRSMTLTQIDFSLPEAAEVSLNVYNIKGQLVKTLASGELSAGKHTVSWDGNNVNNQSVGSGVYFYRLDNGREIINRKMLIVK